MVWWTSGASKRPTVKLEQMSVGREDVFIDIEKKKYKKQRAHDNITDRIQDIDAENYHKLWNVAETTSSSLFVFIARRTKICDSKNNKQ